jgi:transketolase
MNMHNPDAKLVADVFSPTIEMKPTRDGFGTGVTEAAENDERIVVLCADLSESTRAEWFEKKFPERFVEVGVAEQNLAALGSGFAAAGKIPFIASYAAFSPGRNYEQIRTTIALNQQPVKICGMHAGVSVGPDGATHQMLEDISLMRGLPHMVVINPADAEEARKATIAAALHNGPVYLRFGRSNTPTFTTKETPFEIGKALVLHDNQSPKVAIISTGSLSYQALLAARALEADGIGAMVVHVHTIKPLDEEEILEVAKRAGHIVTVEEHQITGGLGSAVAEFLSEVRPTPIRRLGVHDRFGQSGTPEELLEEYGMNAVHIAGAAREMLGKA